MDNLSTHSPGSRYEAFAAPEAHRILRRLEIHYTPKHASWLNMVELEIGVLHGQCLDRRIGDRKKLISEIAAWVKQRNKAKARIKWMFNTEMARKSLRMLILTPPRGHNLCARVLGRSDEARAALDKAIAIAPDVFRLYVE